MKIQGIVDRAVKKLGTSCPDLDDVEEKAPYILGTFLCEHSHYWKAYAQMNEECPVKGKVLEAAVSYLCSMLLSDDNPEGSDVYYDAYCKIMCTFR